MGLEATVEVSLLSGVGGGYGAQGGYVQGVKALVFTGYEVCVFGGCGHGLRGIAGEVRGGLGILCVLTLRLRIRLTTSGGAL